MVRWFALVLLCVTYARAEEQLLFNQGSNSFIVPVQGITLKQFLERSILFSPKDVVRDGLPWYGSKRDDWIPGKRTRVHTGLDYYSDSIVVLACEEGDVIAVGRGGNSGGNIRIRHRDSIETLYLHISKWLVWNGQHVKRGEPIGLISKPEGNAKQTQLHITFEQSGKRYDPLANIRTVYSKDQKIAPLLHQFDISKSIRTTQRDSLLKSTLSR